MNVDIFGGLPSSSGSFDSRRRLPPTSAALVPLARDAEPLVAAAARCLLTARLRDTSALH